jgi:hypothetical protein
VSWSGHLAKGLRLLGERWFDRPRRWILTGESLFDKAVRAVMICVPGYVLWRLLSSSWKVLCAAVLVVIVLALRAATKAAKGAKGEPAKAAKAPDDTPPTATVDGLPAVDPGAFLGLVRDVLGVASGVHLRTLAAALTARVGGAWDVADVRALCEAYGVPVRPTVRAPGGGPTVGVHRADLTPLLGPSRAPSVGADVADYTAGQNTTTTPTTSVPTTPTTPTVTEHGGLRIVAQDDPGNPARTHVTVIDPARRKRA